jgi:hypothetical protein
MKSSNDDNIHKSIKYKIWSTAPKNLETISDIYNEFRGEKSEKSDEEEEQ